MRLFISGYSVGETYTIGMYDLGEEGKEKKLLWSSDVENPSYLAYHDNMLFGITEKDVETMCVCSWRMEMVIGW